MKIELELEDTVTFALVAFVITLGITTLGVHGCRQSEETRREAYRNGYEEYLEKGNTTQLWRKADKHEN